jgi:uncharacterized NAD(P)/FAD-binding protein YdhS
MCLGVWDRPLEHARFLAPTRPELGTSAFAADPRFIADPWDRAALETIPEGSSILLVGTGLTMADVALTLAGRGAQLHAVSRHGLLPLSHPVTASASSVDVPHRADHGSLIRWARDSAATEHEHGAHWSATIDAFQPSTQALWQSLSNVEQNRFLRHLARYWNVHRHRMPPATAAAISVLLDRGQLTVCAGRIRSVTPDGSRLAVRIEPRKGDQATELRITHIVNCAGPQARITTTDAPPPIRALLAGGAARLDLHGLGLDTDPGGALMNRSGRPSPTLFAIGALRRGTLWETTAIPELRVQTGALAQRIRSRTSAAA